jgi:tetratricopeptide (TPR) repeat protein
MSTSSRQHAKVWGGTLFGIALIIVFRWYSLSSDIWINAGLVIFQQHPTWNLEPNDTIIDTITTQTLLEKIKDNSEDSVPIISGIGLILFLQDRYEEAISSWQMTGLDPAQILASQGRYTQAKGQPERALVWYERAVTIDDHQADIWYEAAQSYEITGNINEAITSYGQSLTLGHTDSIHPLAKLLRNEKRYDEAITIWRTALATQHQHPHELDWWQGLTNSFRATEQWTDALQTATAATNRFPNDARLYVELGYAQYYANNDIDGAVTSLNQAIVLDNDLAIAYAAMGDILFKRGLHGEAYTWFDQAIELDSGNRSWLTSRAVSARASGEIELSIHLFQEIIDEYPDWANGHYQIAMAHHQSGNELEATKAIELALSLIETPNPQYFNRAGLIFESQGEIDQAVEYYRQTLILDVDNDIAAKGINRLLGN